MILIPKYLLDDLYLVLSEYVLIVSSMAVNVSCGFPNEVLNLLSTLYSASSCVAQNHC